MTADQVIAKFRSQAAFIKRFHAEHGMKSGEMIDQWIRSAQEVSKAIGPGKEAEAKILEEALLALAQELER